MRFRIQELTLPLDYSEGDIRAAVVQRCGVPEEAVRACRIVRRSVDARLRREGPVFVINAEADIDDAVATRLARIPKVEAVVETEQEDVSTAASPVPEKRPVVIGAGPAGLFAAWRLARAGWKPLLLERGAPVEERIGAVGAFWNDGTLDPENNVLFGEGGAGLFSDGKLNTRSKLRGHVRTILEALVASGASEEILIEAEPHVGSDRLKEIVPCLRREIESLGGEVRFHARVDGVCVEDGVLRGVVVNGELIATEHCVLATGHSAHDVYELLEASGVALEAKPFAVGLRVELPQAEIDRSQYGTAAGHPRLGAASFRLTRKPSADVRACYTFCTCPGGTVMACASEPGRLTTNGMSLSARNGVRGNAAFLVPVQPEEFGGLEAPLAGLAWQAKIEREAFRLGGGDYSLPASMLEDFLEGRIPKTLPKKRSAHRAVPTDLRMLLPEAVTLTLVHAIPRMLRSLRHVRLGDAVVYGAETRSSSPVRVLRDESFQSTSVRGLYPAGEGAGYAGGIVTSAVDGLRVVEAMLSV